MSNVTSIATAPSGELQITSMDQAIQVSEALSRSTMVPKDFVGNPSNILIAIIWGKELGLGPIQCMQSIAVINGRPSIFGDALMALVRGSGLLESINETDDGDTATCVVKRKNEDPQTRTFSMADAQLAGLAGKPGPWKLYPKRMRQLRARSFALRDVFADVLRGLHISDESINLPPVIKDITPAPAGKKSGVSAVKAKLKAKAEPVEADVVADTPEVSIAMHQAMEAIEAAATKAELASAGALAGLIQDETEKGLARSAYTLKIAELEG